MTKQLRPEQLIAWEKMREHTEHTPLFMNIATGLGKTTLISLKASHEYQRTGQPVLICFPTHALIKQYLASSDDLGRGNIKPDECGVWLPKSAFASPSKCAKLGIELEVDGELSDEVVSRCKDDYEALTAFDIGLGSDSTQAELAVWRAHKEDLGSKRYILCTQSAFLQSVWSENYFGIDKFSYVLIDEAHLLPQMAALSFNRTIGLHDLEWLKTPKPKVDLSSITEQSLSYYIERCKVMRAQDKTRANDLLYRFNALAKNINAADRNSFLNIGILSNGDWKIEFKRPANIINWAYERYPICYLSGTMVMDKHQSFTSFARDLGAAQAHKDSLYLEPNNFGTAYFMQAKMEPNELREYLRIRQQAIDCNERAAYKMDLDLTVAVARHAMTTGNVLILTAATVDTLAIAERLGDLCVHQEARQSMKIAAPRYEASDKAILVSHGAWEGLDIKAAHKRFKHIVITRIPYAYPSELLDIPFYNYQMVCMRKLRQGFGRGIRRADDECTYWILDKRFPSRGYINSEFQVNNDQFSAHSRLNEAIWERFRNPMFKQFGHSKAKLVSLSKGALLIR